MSYGNTIHRQLEIKHWRLRSQPEKGERRKTGEGWISLIMSASTVLELCVWPDGFVGVFVCGWGGCLSVSVYLCVGLCLPV